jgi:hypothetical protein
MAPEQSTQTEQGAQSFYAPGTVPGTAPTPAQPAHTAPQPYATYPGAYGQPFQPYQQHQQQLPQGPEPRPAWEMTKIVLHALAVVFGVIALGTGLGMLSSHWSGIIFALCSAPLAALCIIWSGVELIVRATRKWKSGMHPGAHVGVCLIVWLGAAFVGGIEATYLAVYDYYDDDYDNDTRCWNSSLHTYEQCNPHRYYKDKRGVATAATAFTILLWLIYFILFIGACVDTAKRNNARRAGTIVYMPPVSYYAPPGPNGWPQQQQQPQHPAAAAGIPLQNRDSQPETSEPKIPAAAASPPQSGNGAGVSEFYSPQGGR